MPIDSSKLRALRKHLLAWFAEHRRDLPWRAAEGEAGDAYHIFLSEIMLQQTQVATVIAYFHRFIEAFPTIEALAAAEEQRVLRLWQGLGYYRRARNLHAAARMIVTDHGGVVPRDVKTLLTLPGIGRYTAGAIASIAYGTQAPLVDGNVMRVLARWFAIEEAIDAPATIKKLWALAEELVPVKQAGDFNQAMMELGSLVCTPRGPSCLVCPVRELCDAATGGKVERIPVKKSRTKPRAVTHHIVAVARDDGAFLFQQRPSEGLWSNLWQLPTCESFEGEVDAKSISKWVREVLGLTVNEPREVEQFSHQTTHRTITFVVWRMKVKSVKAKRESGEWRKVDAVDDLPLANPQRRAVEMLNT